MNRCDQCGTGLYLGDDDACPACVAKSAPPTTRPPTLPDWLLARLLRWFRQPAPPTGDR